MNLRLEESTDIEQPAHELSRWMERYQQADAEATRVLIRSISPLLLRLFRSQASSKAYAEDLLQETWMRIHRVRHTYRPGEPVLPWIYAIARRVRIDSYRRTQRIAAHEATMEVLPEPARSEASRALLPDFETLMAVLPEGQREVISLLKVSGLSLEEVAKATSSTVGSVKQKAHKGYKRLRAVLEAYAPGFHRKDAAK